MNLAADWVDRMAVPWASAMARTCLESSAVLALVGAVWWLGRKRLSAATLHALFLLVLVKLAVPIPLSLPVPASWGRFSPSTASDRVASWASAPQADPAAVVPFDEHSIDRSRETPRRRSSRPPPRSRPIRRRPRRDGPLDRSS